MQGIIAGYALYAHPHIGEGGLCKDTLEIEELCITLQLSTTEGNSYYVGTKMDAFVFDTLNAWYQEDMNTVSFPSSVAHHQTSETTSSQCYPILQLFGHGIFAHTFFRMCGSGIV
jgi:hypothetical protein